MGMIEDKTEGLVKKFSWLYFLNRLNADGLPVNF